MAAGTALAGPFQGFVAHAAGTTQAKVPNLGPLGPVADARDGVVRLHLPTGFQYRSFHDNQAVPKPTLDGGAFVPGRHDGMAAFAGPTSGTVTLIRNHEISSFGAPFAAGAPVYDARGPADDLHRRRPPRQRPVGRGQPDRHADELRWRPHAVAAWVTCEETVNGPDVFDDFTRATVSPPERPTPTSRTRSSSRSTGSSSKYR